MSSMDILDDELTLDPDGHLSDVGAAVLADGQHELLSPQALQHALACPECGLRAGDQALRSLDTHLALAAPAEAPTAALTAANDTGGSIQPFAPLPAPTRAAPPPWWALAAAAAVAVLGLLPSLLSPETHESARTLLRILPALLLALRQTLQGPEVAATIERASWVSAAALWAAGAGLAWYASRIRRENQGEAP